MFLKINKGKNFSDEELVNKYKDSQNQEYLGILFQRYTHLLFGVCMKYLKNEEEAKDAVFSIYEKLTKDLIKHQVEYFKSWLYMLTKNYCLMQLRKKQSLQKKQDKLEKNTPLFMENTVEIHLHDEESTESSFEKLKLAISSLKEEQRECIKMFFIEEKSYKEIEEETGFPLKKVKSYIQNGKRNLKIYLEKSNFNFKHCWWLLLILL